MKNPSLVAGITRFLSATVERAMRDMLDDHHYMLKDVFTRAGFTVIGTGYFRMCLTHPLAEGVVFKVNYAARYGSYYEGMAEGEYHFYNHVATTTEQRHLARCHHAEKYVSVMDKVSHRRSEYAPDAFRKILGYVRCNRRPEYGDGHMDNIVFDDNNNPVMIDYAVNWEPDML